MWVPPLARSGRLSFTGVPSEQARVVGVAEGLGVGDSERLHGFKYKALNQTTLGSNLGQSSSSLCDFRQITSPLCSSVSLSIKNRSTTTRPARLLRRGRDKHLADLTWSVHRGRSSCTWLPPLPLALSSQLSHAELNQWSPKSTHKFPGSLVRARRGKEPLLWAWWVMGWRAVPFGGREAASAPLTHCRDLEVLHKV